MNDEKYIELVKIALDSYKTVADKIAEVATLELPHNASPLVALIHGDSQQLGRNTYGTGHRVRRLKTDDYTCLRILI